MEKISGGKEYLVAGLSDIAPLEATQQVLPQEFRQANNNILSY